jgi:hypothetical protein
LKNPPGKKKRRYKIEEMAYVRRIDGTITLLYFMLVYVKVYVMSIAIYRGGVKVLKFVYDRPVLFEINNSSSSACSRISALGLRMVVVLGT